MAKIASIAKKHPTAIIDPAAELADDVRVGPYCVIESDVTIGPGTVLAEYVVVRRYTSIGCNNSIDSHTVLGGHPQDYKFDPSQISFLRIGDNNIFREGVTVSRATGQDQTTVIGSGIMWMAGSHAGHNAQVHDNAILVNGATVGGFGVLSERAILSAYASIHQFTWVGRMAMLQGTGGASMHVPPYTLTAGINRVVGLNIVGLKRAEDITDEDRKQIKEAFSLTYRSSLTTTAALEKMDACTDWGKPADEFRQFVRRVISAEPPYKRGLCPLRKRRGPN